jgi:hypothetical protein
MEVERVTRGRDYDSTEGECAIANSVGVSKSLFRFFTGRIKSFVGRGDLTSGL